MKNGIVNAVAMATVIAVVAVCAGDLRAQQQPDAHGSVAAEVSVTSSVPAAAETNIFAFEGVTPLSAIPRAGRLESAPPLFRFMIGVFIFLIIPALFKKLYLPSVVGLIIAGILCGPHVFRLVRPSTPVLATLV